MDVIACRAFERPDVEANRAGCNPRQHGSCLAGGADWSPDGHDAIASSSGGSATELSVTGIYRGGGDAASLEPLKFYCCSILLIFEKLMTRSAPTILPAWIEGRASRKWNPNCSCSVRYTLRAPQPVEPTLCPRSAFQCRNCSVERCWK